MRRLALIASTAVAASMLTVVPPTGPASAQPEPVPRESWLTEILNGWDIYTHTTASDYRTAPAILNNLFSDVNYQYTCGPGPSGPAEVIRTAVSSDSGSHWGPETIVLAPTTQSPGAGDSAGVCDPAIVKIGDYYYLAYTGLAANGQRQLFAARSTSTGGPFAKWNGTTWGGGTPAPLLAAQAAGPSLIVQGATLYLYFNVRLPGATYQTRLATASLGSTPDTWPQRLQAQPGVAIEHPERYDNGNDCVGNHWQADTDVKVDPRGNFVALTTDQTYPWTVLQAYESADGGHTFRRTVITRADYQRGARSPAMVSTDRGMVALGDFAYAHSTGCGYADLHYSRVQPRPVLTGAVDEPLTSSAANWQPGTGTWQISALGTYLQSDQTPETAESYLTGAAAIGSSTIRVRMRGSAANHGGWVGVHFDQNHIDAGPAYVSGYLAYVENAGGGRVNLCLHKAGFGVLGCQRGLPLDWTKWMDLEIVQAGGRIGVDVNGNPALTVSSVDADDPYLGGYVSLATAYTSGEFTGFSISDNVPGSSMPSDWLPNGGTWSVASGTVINAGISGQINMRSQLAGGQVVPSRLGDGTYAASIGLTSGAGPQAWGGLVLSDGAMTGSWSSGGYLVFLLGNGNVGIWKGGTGQVVADVPTGADPRGDSIPLRVLKTGNNLQVYVGQADVPAINWTDGSGSNWAIGGFGLANLLTQGIFTDVTYNGDAAR